MVREKRGGLPEGRASQATSAAVSFGRYQLIKKLAAGGMAEVYLARQQGLEGFEKLIVVKRILPHLANDEEFTQMFLNEARIAARFNHANIVQIYDLGEVDGSYFIGMEYVHGEDLGRVMRKAWNAGRWIPMQLALRVIAGACEGLYYAHTKNDEDNRPLNVVHRDISPQNILVSFDGGVKIVDFGIAKAADSSGGTRNGTIKGKYAYMSPEQAGGKSVDCRTDVFALGLVLYELLTGVRPLKRETDIMTLQAALACEIQPPSQVAQITDTLDPVVMRALARDVNERYQTAREFQLAIEDYLVQERLAASSVHLSEFMRDLFADRLEEEARSGRPAPSVSSDSLQSFPVINVPDTGPKPPAEDRRNSGEKRRGAPAPAPAESDSEPFDVDPDDGPTTEEVKPVVRRTATGSQRRATGEIKRTSSGGNIPAARARARSSSVSRPGDMPDAPPRQAAAEARQRDDSWKDANKPQPRKKRRSGGAGPAFLAVLLAGGAAAYVFRADISRMLAGNAGPAAARSTVPCNVDTNVKVMVEINGEMVGQSPIREWPTAVGAAKVHLTDDAHGIDKTLTVNVEPGGTCQIRQDFASAKVIFNVDKGIADIYANGKKVAQSGGAAVELAEGDYEFVARAENGTLEDTKRMHISKGSDTINKVTFTLHRARK